MELHIVVAATENNVIGRDGGVPWHYPEDVAHYKSTVAGHPVIVGRRTFDSMKPLPRSHHVVLTSDASRATDAAYATYVTSTHEAAEVASATGTDVAYVIGGQGVYETFLPHVHRVVLSRIHDTVEGDRHIPTLGEGWVEQSRDDRGAFTIIEYTQLDPDPLLPPTESASEPESEPASGA